MEGFQYEVTAAWREVRWTIYFLALLFPACLIATTLAALVQGTPSPSPGMLFAFGVPLALLALIGAGLWDGVAGRWGRYVWWPLLLWFGLLLVRAYLRETATSARVELPPGEHGGGAEGRVEAGPHPPIATIGPVESWPSRLKERLGVGRTVAAWLRDRRLGWRELQRLKKQVTHDSADPRVRELRLLIER